MDAISSSQPPLLPPSAGSVSDTGDTGDTVDTGTGSGIEESPNPWGQDEVSLSGSGADQEAGSQDHVNSMAANFSAVSAPAAGKSGPDPYFKHESVDPQDMKAAQGWWPGKGTLSGTQANGQINSDYHRLNQQMQKYQQGDPKAPQLPKVSDWMTFGKYASREAGEQIRNLEDLMKFAYNGDVKAGADATRNFADKDPIIQAALLGGDTAARNAGQQNPVDALLNPVGAASDALAGTAGDMVSKLDKMRTSLVEGNTEIHRNVAPAYDAFLKGEGDGQKGMDSLKAAGYFPGSEKDPQGFVTHAFEDYKQAREIGLKAQQTQDPAERQQLLAERERLMHSGNLHLGLQEQMNILQKPSIFGDKQMQEALGAVQGTMTLTDANGTHSVGQADKNWTDFSARMGLKEVAQGTPGAVEVRDHSGKSTWYQEDPSKSGTISEYFRDNLSGPKAENLMSSQPRPIYNAPTTPTGKAVDNVATNLQQGNVGGTAGAVAALPVRAAADLTQRAGGAVANSGRRVEDAGIEMAAQGLNEGGLVGTAKVVTGLSDAVQGSAVRYAGQAVEVGGQVVDLAGQGLQAAGNLADRGLNAAGNAVQQSWDWLWR